MTRTLRRNFVMTLFLLAGLVLPMLFTACRRERRAFHSLPAGAQSPPAIPANNPVRPGPNPTDGQPPTEWGKMAAFPSVGMAPEAYAYQNNAQAQSNGQRLFETMNCAGCHARGGGGMAPPLIDEKWLYGGEPQNIYLTILQGRPNGMPSFRGRINDNEIWALVGFVRSLSGQAHRNAAAGREDHMAAQPPPNSIGKATPQSVAPPQTMPATQTTISPSTTQSSTRPATTQAGGSNG
jgi:cytochrome c oxidase cbb3-type subunit 3